MDEERLNKAHTAIADLTNAVLGSEPIYPGDWTKRDEFQEAITDLIQEFTGEAI